MQQAWHLQLLLDCIKTSGSGLGEFSGGFSGFPCSCGVSSTLRCFPLYKLHLHCTTHLDTFPNCKWIFSLNKLKPPSSKILPLKLVHKDLTDSRIPACSLTHPLVRKMVSLSCSFNWQRAAERWKEDLPNSAIFKLSCRSKYFGSFWKRRLKDTEPKCLRSKSSSIVTIPMALLYIQSSNVVIVWQKFPNPVGVARDGDGTTKLDRQAHIAAHWWSVF